MQLDDDCLILAERLRVEERLILAACEAAGTTARLIQPGDFTRLLAQHDGSSERATLINRLPATTEATALATLARQAGFRVVNPPELTGLLANRLLLLAHLRTAGVPTVEFQAGWGADAALEAIESVSDDAGYPVRLAVQETATPPMTVRDREAAEALIEHRMVLGDDRLFIVQPYAEVSDCREIHIIGERVFVPGSGSNSAMQSDRQIADSLRDALGPGMYTAVVAGGDCPRIGEVSQPGQFRDLEQPEEVASAISGLVSNSLEITL